MFKCKHCGAGMIFDPKLKKNICVSCNSCEDVNYNHTFSKKSFNDASTLQTDLLYKDAKNVKCKSCGANLLVNKLQITSKCLYCGSETITASSKKNLLNIDSVVPFTFGKADAIKKFKRHYAEDFSANKKIFKNLSEQDVVGLYVNSFVFDFTIFVIYNGVLAYTTKSKNSSGETYTETISKPVSGVLEKVVKNLTVEANANLEQKDLSEIMPYEYTSAVAFQKDFMNGYVIEYQDKLFNDCVSTAQGIVNEELKKDILKKHGCDQVESLDMNITYRDRKYNYCLLPVYMFNKVYKNKRYKVFMNGQSGKIGHLPKNKFKVFFTVLLTILGILGILFLIFFVL